MKTNRTESATADVAENLLAQAAELRASDLHLEPRGEGTAVRVRVDGELRQLRVLPRELGDRVTARLKALAGMDLTDRKTPQDGRFSRDQTDVRVSTLPTLRGEALTARLLNGDARPHGAEALGFFGEALSLYDRMLRLESGLVLIVGPSGSGKSTTLYEMLSTLSGASRSVVTLEDPVEYTMDGVSQVPVNGLAGVRFADGMRAVLRQDPDVVAVGEVRDAESARAVHRAAITGRPVFATVHARNAGTLPGRMNDLAVSPGMLAESLRGLIVQRLVRRTCPACGGNGCDACGGSGFRGRVGAFGCALLADGESASPARLREADEMLAENCGALAAQGITTEEEADRVRRSV